MRSDNRREPGRLDSQAPLDARKHAVRRRLSGIKGESRYVHNAHAARRAIRITEVINYRTKR
jgi:hypothetical protein